jgi:hypothetical protein
VSNDPLSIGLSKLAELLRGFGLDPVDVKTLKAVHILPDGITVIRHRLDERGRAVVVGDELATETVTIRLEHSR